jgi:hypothetical protein
MARAGVRALAFARELRRGIAVITGKQVVRAGLRVAEQREIRVADELEARVPDFRRDRLAVDEEQERRRLHDVDRRRILVEARWRRRFQHAVRNTSSGTSSGSPSTALRMRSSCSADPRPPENVTRSTFGFGTLTMRVVRSSTVSPDRSITA